MAGEHFFSGLLSYCHPVLNGKPLQVPQRLLSGTGYKYLFDGIEKASEAFTVIADYGGRARGSLKKAHARRIPGPYHVCPGYVDSKLHRAVKRAVSARREVLDPLRVLRPHHPFGIHRPVNDETSGRPSRGLQHEPVEHRLPVRA